jgi:hypothetical protein
MEQLGCRGHTTVKKQREIHESIQHKRSGLKTFYLLILFLSSLFNFTQIFPFFCSSQYVCLATDCDLSCTDEQSSVSFGLRDGAVRLCTDSTWTMAGNAVPNSTCLLSPAELLSESNGLCSFYQLYQDLKLHQLAPPETSG